MNKTTNLSTLIQQVLQAPQAWQLKLIAYWPAIIGSIHTKVRLEKIEGATAILAVADAAWLQELYLLSEAIVEKMNNFLGERRISTLKFKRAGLKKTAKTAQRKPRMSPEMRVPLSARESKTLTHITDTELRSYLEAYLQRCKR